MKNKNVYALLTKQPTALTLLNSKNIPLYTSRVKAREAKRTLDKTYKIYQLSVTQVR